jgi:hypothetical protein
MQMPRTRVRSIGAFGLFFSLFFTVPSSHAATFNIADGDVAALISAIRTANSNGESNTINLAVKGNYVLTAAADNTNIAAGLPFVTSNTLFTINGNGATIQRSTAVGTPDFLILQISAGAAIVNNVTLMGGSQAGLRMSNSTVTVQNSTITQNTGAGGIYNECGNLTVTNSTISYNSSDSGYGGGGIELFQNNCSPTLNLSFSTLYENANPGFGRGNSLGTNAGNPQSVVIKNSILASPSHPSEAICNPGVNYNMILSLGHNIIGDASCAVAFTGPGDMNSTSPLLGPTVANGGPTPVDLPATNSPVIDAVPIGDCTDVFNVAVLTDQRGVFRPQGLACDIGAVEVFPFDDDSAFANLKGGNTFTGSQTINGSVVATSFVGDGSALIGVGKIMSVTAGTGLAGGGTAGDVTLANTGILSITTGSGITSTGGQTPTLSLDPTATDGRYLRLTGGTLTGSVTAPTFTGNGATLTNLNPANISGGTAGINISGNAATSTNASTLGGVLPGSYARRDVSNSFTGDQNVFGSVFTTGSLSIGSGTSIVRHVSVAYTLALPSLKPGSCTQVTEWISGAQAGASDPIALGIPASFMSAGGFLMFQAWESATNMITIRVCNVNPNGPPSSAVTDTIRVDLWKH